MKTPETHEEWQEAVDAAYVLILIHDARLYGLITGGPEINLERCEWVLAFGKRMGVIPRPDAMSARIEEVGR